MGLGKTARLNRIFSHPSGRMCSIAGDHFLGYQTGLPEGLKDLPATIAKIVAGSPDAVTMNKGVALGCWEAYAGKLHLIVQSVVIRPDDSANHQLATPEDAVLLGADAIATVVFAYGDTQAAQLKRTADTVREAHKLEMPVILHIYPRIFHDDGTVTLGHHPEGVEWAVRCGIETGVDIIKTPYTGDVESFRQIIDACPVPVVAAGGPQTATLDEALEALAGVVAAGGRGATVGRNIWGVEDITGAVEAVKGVIHGTVD